MTDAQDRWVIFVLALFLFILWCVVISKRRKHTTGKRNPSELKASIGNGDCKTHPQNCGRDETEEDEGEICDGGFDDEAWDIGDMGLGGDFGGNDGGDGGD
jgi:hypothetical protein